MRTGRLEIEDALIGREFAVQEPRGILDELDVGAVEFGEGLLVFALHHDLRLRLQGFEAKFLQAFDTQVLALGHLYADTSRAALRVRDSIDIAGSTGVLR